MGKGKLGVIGAGVMGKTLIQGLLQKGVYKAKDVWASARTEASCLAVENQLGIKAFTQYGKVLPNTDVLLLCVKPAQVSRVLEQLQRNGLKESTLVISIVAGTAIEQMESGLLPKSPVIRAMTNTPCVVSQGMTVICGGTHAEKIHLTLAQEIFESVGICLSLEEQHFDAITGLSGSGPAYLYLVMEALADGGVRVGLPRDVALKVVSQVVLGAATMVQQTGRHPAALRDDVTTPAGCTIGGLLIMEDGKIRSVLARAVEEATAIASQLGKAKNK